MDISQITFVSILSAWATMTIAYLISMYRSDVSIVDVFWGISFVVVARALLLANDSPTLWQTWITIAATLWGARLALHIGSRKLGEEGEDPRYQKFRDNYGDSFWWMSYIKIFMVQALLMLVVAAPIWLSAFQTDDEGTKIYALIGFSVWLVGFFFESVGDYQLSQFIKRKKAGKTKKQIMTQGVWKYTRHPNFFGEVTQWWGLFIVIAPLSYGWIGIISPLLITYLILKVSGIPTVEERYEGNKEFAKYKKKTSAFFPLPSTKNLPEIFRKPL